MYLLDQYSVHEYLMEMCHNVFAFVNLYLALAFFHIFLVSSGFHLYLLSFPHLGAPVVSGLGPSVATATSSEGTVHGPRQDAARTHGGNPSNNSTATRGLPTRTVVAAIPARSSVDIPNHVLSVLLPVQVRSQVAVPNQSASPQNPQNTMGNGSQQNSTSAVPQASVGGVAGIPSVVAQVTQHVANAMAANAGVQVPSSAQNTAEQESRLTTDSRASDLNSSTAITTHVQTHATETGILDTNLLSRFFLTDNFISYRQLY